MIVADRYELKQKLGEGGMGKVYQAFDMVKKRNCAIKLLTTPDGVSEENKKRFIREIIILSGIKHPSIVKFFESGEYGNSFYYAMEFIDGRPISSVKMETGTMINHICQIASALGELHLKGIVHRDIKPANILIADGKAILVDFGIAHLQADGARLTRTGNVIGTASYMAPEQVMGREIDGRLDIYSLGVVLYEMLTGKTPFVDNNIVAQIYRIIEEKPKLPRKIDPSIPEELETICLKCLQKSPDHRYMDTTELITALKNFEKGIAPEEATIITTSSDKMPLIGRKEIIEKINDLLSSITTGTFHSLRLKGSSGMGKSRLLTEFKSTTFAKKIIYLSCDPELTDKGNPAISSLLTEMSKYKISPDNELINAHAGLIRSLSPQLADKLKLPETAKSQNEEARAELLAELICSSFEGRTVVFGFEDDLDPLSSDVMKKIIKMRPAGKLVVSVTEQKSSDEFTDTIILKPLTKNHLAKLALEVLGHEISIIELDALNNRTNGNPLFAYELLKSSKKSDKDITVTSLPQNITDIFINKFQNLPTKARELLIKMSMTAKPLPLTDIKAISRYPDRWLSSTLSRLVNDNLVRERDAGGEILFIVNGVVADKILGTLESDRKQKLSLELAGTLEIIDSEKYLFEIGKHYILGGKFEKGAGFIVSVGLSTNKQMNPFETRRSIEFFKDRVEDISDINTKVKAYLALVDYHKAKGELALQANYFEKVERLIEEEDIDISTKREALFTKFLALQTHLPNKKLLGITDDILKITDSDSPLRSQFLAHTFKASALLANKMPEKALEWDKKALKIAKESNNSNDWYGAINNLAVDNIELKNFDRAIDYLNELKDFAEKNYDIYYISSALINLGILYLQQGELEKSCEQLDKALEFAEKHKQYNAMSFCLIKLTQRNFVICDIASARKYISKTKELHKVFSPRVDRFSAQLELSICLAILDDDQETFFTDQQKMSELRIATNSPALGSEKYISDVEYALSKLDFKTTISICKKFNSLYEPFNETSPLFGNQILMLLWESFVSGYQGNFSHAITTYKKAVKFLTHEKLKHNFWIAKVANIVSLAYEVTNTKKAYGAISGIMVGGKRRNIASDTHSKLCKSVTTDKASWKETFFYFYPRLTWMLGEFTVWLVGCDKNHPDLEVIINDTTLTLKKAIAYLKENKMKAYIRELEEQKRGLAWKMKE